MLSVLLKIVLGGGRGGRAQIAEGFDMSALDGGSGFGGGGMPPGGMGGMPGMGMGGMMGGRGGGGGGGMPAGMEEMMAKMKGVYVDHRQR